MRKKSVIRESLASDMAAMEQLYRDAFPEEDLLPVVKELLQEGSAVLSLVATIDSSVVGHVIFTICGIEGSSQQVALLGPLAVASAFQRQGIGSDLVKTGIQRMESAGMTHVLVLGDPAYYGRFGFVPGAEVIPPYPLPAEWRDAWQFMNLRGVELNPQGNLRVPQPWRHEHLWIS